MYSLSVDLAHTYTHTHTRLWEGETLIQIQIQIKNQKSTQNILGTHTPPPVQV